jgi:hypothetical protein
VDRGIKYKKMMEFNYILKTPSNRGCYGFLCRLFALS